jgi:hypothetical protein
MGGRRVSSTDERAQSEVIAVATLLAVGVIAIAVILAQGVVGLNAARDASEIERTTTAMGVLDSRASLVALGESDEQVVTLGDSGDGTYHIDEEAGWLRIEHSGYAPGETELIYNETLGAVTYVHGETTIAYQGGGVWRLDGDSATMVSPPEFHYRGETLTIPTTRITGSGSVAGRTDVCVTPGAERRHVFPNEEPTGVSMGAPYDATGDPYRNSLQNGTVIVTVHSEFYRAWGEYFETRTGGAVTVDDATKTASLRLTAEGLFGRFDVPEEGLPIRIRGLCEGHPITNFTVVLAPDDLDAARFDNLQWSLYADEGNQEFEIHLRLQNPDNDPATLCKEQHISATVYYSDTNGDDYHGWYDREAFRTTCVDRDKDGLEDEVELVANLTGEVPLTMQDLTNKHLETYNPSSAPRLETVTFDGHAAQVGWEPKTFSDAGEDTTTMHNLTNHYLSLMGPNVDVIVDDKSSDTIAEHLSWGVLEYCGRGRIAFLHVTDNELEAEFR